MARKKAAAKKKKTTCSVPAKLKRKGQSRKPTERISTPLDNIKTLI